MKNSNKVSAMRFSTLGFMFAALLAVPAFAADSPEKNAVGAFFQFCVLTKSDPKIIDLAMKPVVEAKAGGRVPAETLEKRTGMKAENAWVIRLGEERQELLLVTLPGICAMHLNNGDGKIVKEAFTKELAVVATDVKGVLKLKEEKKHDGATFSAYEIESPNSTSKTAVVFGISVAEKASKSGTKHLLTYSPKVKKD